MNPVAGHSAWSPQRAAFACGAIPVRADKKDRLDGRAGSWNQSPGLTW